MLTKQEIETCVERSGNLVSNLTEYVLGINGMSNGKVRHLINNLLSVKESNFLEIGTYHGSTFCAAICNSMIKNAATLDYFTYFDVTNNSNLGRLNREKVIENVEKTPHKCNVSVIDANVYDFDFSSVSFSVNSFFYDGPHETDNCLSILRKAYDILEKDFLFIVDDFSDQHQSAAIEKFIIEFGINVLHRVDLPGNGNHNQHDNTNYFNGLFVAACQKL